MIYDQQPLQLMKPGLDPVVQSRFLVSDEQFKGATTFETFESATVATTSCCLRIHDGGDVARPDALGLEDHPCRRMNTDYFNASLRCSMSCLSVRLKVARSELCMIRFPPARDQAISRSRLSQK